MNLMKQLMNNTETKKYLMGSIAVGVLIVFCCAFALGSSSTLMIDGQAMGQVSSANVVTQVMNDAKVAAAQSSGMEIIGSFNTVEVKAGGKFGGSKLSAAEVAEIINDNVDWLTAGTKVSVNNGEYQFSVKSEEEAQSILETLKNTAVANTGDGTIKSVEFQEEVVVENCNVKVSDIQAPAAVLETIQTGVEEIQVYTVKSGDSFWSIAQNHGLSVDALQKLNANIVPERLQIGQEITLTGMEPLINVVIVKEVTVQETIKHNTEYKDTPALFKGETKVVTAGKDGAKEVTYEVREVNGSNIEKTVLNEVVIAEPVTAVVNKGTASLQVSSRSSGSGVLSWPLANNKVTSKYGTRWGRLHAGIDLQAKTGTSVFAAAGGTVELASYSGAYGNCVIINHGNGMKTRYAHLSSIGVKVGQKVSRGQYIGLSGATGRVTGAHLHFEVMVNGTCKNPLNYL